MRVLIEEAAPRRRRQRDASRYAVLSTPGPRDGHVHCVVFNALNGNGTTSPAETDGHVHAVIALEIQIAKGHTHDITDRRCGADHNERGNHPIPRGSRDEG